MWLKGADLAARNRRSAPVARDSSRSGELQFAVQIQETMQQSRRLTAIIEREGDGYVALCPELDVASRGDSLEEARANLIEALTLFFETADASEIEQGFHTDLFVTQVEVPIGYGAYSISKTGSLSLGSQAGRAKIAAGYGTSGSSGRVDWSPRFLLGDSNECGGKSHYTQDSNLVGDDQCRPADATSAGTQ